MSLACSGKIGPDNQSSGGVQKHRFGCRKVVEETELHQKYLYASRDHENM